MSLRTALQPATVGNHTGLAKKPTNIPTVNRTQLSTNKQKPAFIHIPNQYGFRLIAMVRTLIC